MGKSFDYGSMLMLEDFDIKNIAKINPDREIGVNVNRIYIQIAKINGNPHKQGELQILVNALPKMGDYIGVREPAYVPMKTADILMCFKKHLKRLPKNTFIKI